MTYFIKVGEETLYMDSHDSIKVSYSGEVSKHPTADKKTQSDNYMLNNPTASINGIVSDVGSGSGNLKSASAYIDSILAARDSRQPLQLKHRLDKPAENYWFITGFTPSQDNTHGYGAEDSTGIIQSFKISMTLERIVPAQSLVVEVEVPEAFKDALVERKETKAATKNESLTKDNQTTTQRKIEDLTSDIENNNARIALILDKEDTEDN